MTAVLSPYSTVGFYKAPATKSLLGGLFITSCAFYAPQFAHLKNHLICTVTDVFGKYGIIKFFVCRSTFLDVKDLVCGALLFYYFRVFEKRYGSHKFCSKLIITWLIALTLEFFVLNIINKLDLVDIYGPSGFLITGPFGLITSLFVDYFFDIPRVAQTRILGVPITGKTLTYCIGLQMISSSVSSAISGLCGILAGLIYRYNICRIQKFRVPSIISKLLSLTIGRLIASSPPPDSIYPMGATLEIQRSQQLELLEQQMMINRGGEQRMYERLYAFQNGYQEANNGLIHRRPRDNSNPIFGQGHNSETINENTNLSENQIQTLVEMGFDRERVIAALQSSGNDLHQATTLLLQDT